ncbi:MAG TPA: hypothetical protein VLB82_05035 [Thermodesulfobacteriota bacterium]|nr:hypothetical protein [Thermodesulfobacteriota bacterium]
MKLKIVSLMFLYLSLYSIYLPTYAAETTTYGNWTVTKKVDEFTGDKSLEAKIRSINIITGWLSQKGKAYISIHCGKLNYLTFISIGIEGGVGFNNSFMDFKVDDNDGVQTFSWNGDIGDDIIFSAVGKGAIFSESSKTPIMFEQMKTGKKIKIRINPFKTERQVVEFNLNGSDKALTEVETFCTELNK